jgi:3D (Asp-Asp-Asp) domain-containing protein
LKIKILIWNLVVVCFLSFCFPTSFIFLQYANNSFAEKKEACSSKKEKSFANLDEPIVHNGQINSNAVIKDEPIRPGKILSEQREDNGIAPVNPKKKLKVVLSGYYTPIPNQPWYLHGNFRREWDVNGGRKKTSSGAVPQKGRTVAADPKVLPPGTEIRIEGLSGIFKVEDTGGAIKGKKIDLYTGEGFSALKEALNLPKKVLIEVL